MFKKCFVNIKKHKESFFSSVISMIAVFMLINLIIFGLFNLRAYKIETSNTNQIILYISTLDDDKKAELQKELLGVNGVLSLRYESKEVALKAVSLQLGVELSEDKNPLSDAIYVYIDEDVDLTQLRNRLESIPEISEVDLRTDAIDTNREFSKSLNQFMTIAIVTVTVFGLVMVNHLASTSVKVKEKYIRRQLNEGYTPLNIKTIFFMESVFGLIISYIIAYLIYEKLRDFIIIIISTLKPQYKYTDGGEEFIYSILVFFITILLVAFVNYLGLSKYYSRKILKINKKKNKEENKEV